MNDSSLLKEQIRQRTDLVDLVSEHVALRPTGRDFVGLCPFHQEKTPSFSVSPAKQIFKCFGCGAGGDVFTFVQLRESVSFVEAVRMLADRAGIDYDRLVGRRPADGPDRADMARINAWAARAFQEALNDASEGAVARAYIEERRISPEMVQRFGLGWAPDDSDWLIRQARAAGLKEPALRAAGLVQQGSYGGGYCVFRGRLMFPIRDTMNRTIGFGGRTLKGDKAKYLNNSQNALFDKGCNFYGLDLARQAMTETRRAVVVEGYTDCIAAHQFGFTNVVATLGTALTEQQIVLLRRWCDEVILVFDSDAAGANAADRALGVMLRHNLSVRIARVTEGKDPCDFLHVRGAAGFADVLNSANEALGFKWNRTRERFASDGPGGQKEAVRDFVSTVAVMARFGSVDAIQQGLIVNQLSKLLSVPAAEIHVMLTAEARSARGGASVGSAARGPQGSSTPMLAEWENESGGVGDAEQTALLSILEILVNEPGLHADVAAVFRPERIRNRRARRVAERVADLCRRFGEFQLSELMADCEDPADARLVTDFVVRGTKLGNFQAAIADTRARLERMELAREGREAAEALRQSQGGADDEEIQRLSRIHSSLSGMHGFAPGIPGSQDGPGTQRLIEQG